MGSLRNYRMTVSGSQKLHESCGLVIKNVKRSFEAAQSMMQVISLIRRGR
jgi:hypothetical protein